MTDELKAWRPFGLGMTIVKVLCAFLTVVAACSAQQPRPLIQISFPADGAVVNPGQTLSVTVTSPANVSIAQVGVVGQGPIGISDVLTSVPAHFSFAIPPDAACRTYVLSASGLTSAGQYAESAPIQIDVERSDVPVSVSAPMSSIAFSAIGEKSPVTLLATFSDGSVLDITHSTYVSYSSSDPTIASVDANGLATAVASGGASLTATYTQGSQSVQVSIPVTVPTQVVTVSPASLNFSSQNLGTSSTTQQFVVTNVSNQPLSIVGISARGDFSETDNCASSSPLAANGICTISVTFTPPGTGQRSSALQLRIALGLSLPPCL